MAPSTLFGNISALDGVSKVLLRMSKLALFLGLLGFEHENDFSFTPGIDQVSRSLSDLSGQSNTFSAYILLRRKEIS